MSASVGAPTSRLHGATGVEILLLPPTRAYRLLRRGVKAPHGRTVASTFRGPRRVQAALLPLLFLAKELAPYLSLSPRVLVRELRRRDCRVLLCQEYEYPRFDVCVAAGSVARIRVFGVFQGGDYRRWWLERITRPLAVRRAAGLVVASDSEARRVRETYRPRSLARIPNPVDLTIWQRHDGNGARAELGISPRAAVAVWHGRLELRKKGLDTLLAAWSRVSAARTDAVLLLVGSGGDLDEVRRLVDGRTDVVWVDRHLHDRRELARLLSAGDVYVFSSRHEGYPVAPIEAMACGLPVVASDVSGIRDIVGDGGVVVAVDDADALAGSVIELLGDEDRRSALGHAARRAAEAFGSERVGGSLRDYLLGA